VQEIVGSGTIVTIEQDITGFSRVSAGSAFKVSITQGDNESVKIRIDDNVVDYLSVVKNENTLEISLDPDYTYIDVTRQAEIMVPDLYALSLSGASDGTVEGFDFEHEFEFDLSGASRVTGDMTLGMTTLNLSGASEITLSEGWGGDLIIMAAGGSVVNLADLISDSGDVTLSGASSATINVTGMLDYNLSGASQLYYYGEPTLGETALSGGSTAEDMGIR
jgi:hypothetical protein